MHESMAAGGICWRRTWPWRHAIRAVAAQSYLTMRIVGRCRRRGRRECRVMTSPMARLQQKKQAPSARMSVVCCHDRVHGIPPPLRK
jgi:hypothetical protein